MILREPHHTYAYQLTPISDKYFVILPSKYTEIAIKVTHC